jgi:hypothetical protein
VFERFHRHMSRRYLNNVAALMRTRTKYKRVEEIAPWFMQQEETAWRTRLLAQNPIFSGHITITILGECETFKSQLQIT